MKARGIFIRESLIDCRLPAGLEEMVIDQHSHMLGAIEPVQIIVTSSPLDRLPEMAMAVSFSLIPKRFYAHFIDGKLLWVVFPKMICFVPQGTLWRQIEFVRWAGCSLFKINKCPLKNCLNMTIQILCVKKLGETRLDDGERD